MSKKTGRKAVERGSEERHSVHVSVQPDFSSVHNPELGQIPNPILSPGGFKGGYGMKYMNS